MKKAQKKQKEWYDRNSWNIQLSPGDKVLMLLPSRAEKLLAKWYGPYELIRKLDKVNYDSGGMKEKNIFHVNLLKRWYLEEKTMFCEEIEEEENDILELEWMKQQRIDDATYRDQLKEEQKLQLQTLIQKQLSLIKSNPRHTTLTKHKIITQENEKPIRQRPYLLPQTTKMEVISELNDLLETGVVEESYSKLASPMVIVRKKDGTNRICSNYRKLNVVTKFDAYPMP